MQGSAKMARWNPAFPETKCLVGLAEGEHEGVVLMSRKRHFAGIDFRDTRSGAYDAGRPMPDHLLNEVPATGAAFSAKIAADPATTVGSNHPRAAAERVRAKPPQCATTSIVRVRWSPSRPIPWPWQPLPGSCCRTSCDRRSLFAAVNRLHADWLLRRNTAPRALPRDIRWLAGHDRVREGIHRRIARDRHLVRHGFAQADFDAAALLDVLR